MAQSTVRLIVDAQNAIVPLRKVNDQTKKLSQTTDKLKGRLDKSNRSLRDTGRSAKVASTGVKGLVGALRPLLAALAVVQSAKFVLFQTAQLETQTKALENFTGSAEKAQKIVQEIKEFGAVTPFKSSQLIEVTRKLRAFGFETEKVVDMTKRVADIAGTAGADIDGVALAIGKVQAKNKFMQEENMMLLEKGINIQKELQDVTGLTGDELAKAMSKGEVGADKFVEAIVKATSKNGQFFEGAVNQSDTLAGKFSTFVDNVETFAQNLGKIFEEPLKFILDQLNAIAGEFNKMFSLLTDATIGASNRAVGAASFKARFGMQEDAVRDITKAVELLDPTFVKTEKDAAKLFAQLDRISKVMKLVQGPDSATVLEGRGLLNPLIEATNQMDDIRDKVNATLTAQKQLTIETKKTNEKVIKTKDNNEKIKTAVEGTVTLNELFNTGLEQTNFLVDGLNLGTDKFADKLLNVKSETDKLNEKFMEIGQGIEQSIVSNLTDAVNGTKTLGEAAIGVLNQLKQKLIEVALQQATAGLGNKIGGFLGNIFGGNKNKNSGNFLNDIFSKGSSGGSSFGLNLGINTASDFLQSSQGFATGGRPPVNKASLVGERGPELFVPNSAGTIIPNNKLGGGDSITNIVNVSVDASGSSVEGDGATSQQLGQTIALVVQETLVREKRNGGLLA